MQKSHFQNCYQQFSFFLKRIFYHLFFELHFLIFILNFAQMVFGIVEYIKRFQFKHNFKTVSMKGKSLRNTSGIVMPVILHVQAVTEIK